MSCYRCTKSFSIFNKEYGCKNCGFSVCSKCLSHKMAVPKLDNKVEKVCGTCFKTLSNPSKPEKPPSPPANFKRRLEAASTKTEAPLQKPSSSPQVKPKPKVDKNEDLHARLKDLKGMAKDPPPSTDDIRKRLDALKERTADVKSDVKPSSTIDKNVKPFPSSPPKSNEDQVKNLLKQYKEENHLENPDRATRKTNDNKKSDNSTTATNDCDFDLNEAEAMIRSTAEELERQAKRELEDLKKDDEIRKKLESVRGKKGETNRKSDPAVDDSDVDEEDEEAKTQRLIQQILAQDALDARFESDFSKFQLLPNPPSNQPCFTAHSAIAGANSQPMKTQNEEDDMIWCCICNEDATVKCRGCDDDLYCKRCYKEGHSRADYADHRTVPVNKK